MSSGAQERITRITPPSGWSAIDLNEIWQHRELVWFLIWRDIKVLYKQTFLGIAWAVLQPFILMVVFTVIFGRLVKVEAGEIPYSIFAFIGLVIWAYFSKALNNASNSLVGNAPLLSKIYMPRAILPMASTFSPLVDLIFSSTFMLILMAVYGYAPTLRLFYMIPFALMASMLCFSCGLILSSINVRYRDVSYILPFAIQVWFFLTPIVYPANVLSESWRWVFWLNPMTVVVDGFRWAVVDYPFPSHKAMILSLSVIFMLTVGGSYFFKRMESSFADVV